MEDKKILISDPTLRDGNHAVSHQLTTNQIAAYCEAAENAGVPIVEVGHGNGLGASSINVGISATSDFDILKIARKHLSNSKLGIHVIPGFATINKDLSKALDMGVDVIRVASHCSEADVTENHIKFCSKNAKTVFGVLMMSHMLDKNGLLEQGMKMQDYGAEGLILMDSSGNYLPSDVTEKVSYLTENLVIPIGFHAHNNLGMGVANTIAAVEAGAKIVDGCARGFGAGPGNAQLEVIIAVLDRMGYETGIDLYKILDASDLAETQLMNNVPFTNSTSIVSGLSGVFAGFLKPVNRAAIEFNVDPRDLFFALGERGVVAGQEDLILEEAKKLSKKINSKVS
jgi:4-hydroxy 2-oxovalerate aldolase